MANAERQPEKRSKLLEVYNKLNKITLPIGVGVGIFGILTGNPLIATVGFTSAAVDTAQIVVIERANKKPAKKEQVVFQASAA